MKYKVNDKIEIIEDDKFLVIIDEKMENVTFLGELEKDIFNNMKNEFTFETICKSIEKIYPDYLRDDLLSFINQLIDKEIIVRLED